jgi:hypothetical protein
MTHRWRNLCPGYSLLLAALLLMPFDGVAAEADGDTTAAGYEFAYWLGSGLYRIGGRDVWNIVLPFDWGLREPADRRPGMRLLLPVTVGWLDTADLRSDNLQTLTFVPGLEIQFQPTAHWSLRPFAQAGIGKDLSRGENAWIYAGGIRSRFENRLDDYTLILGNALVAAGSQGDGNRSSFGRFDAGIGVERPLNWRVGGRATKLGAFYVASFFSDNAELARSLKPDKFNLGAVHRFGLAVGLQEPYRIFGLELDWLGLSYVTGNNIKGIRLNAGFPL